MTQKELKELKINALALRNLASIVLEQVELAERKGNALSSKSKRVTQADRRADLMHRILTGRLKPAHVKRNK